MSFDCFVVVDVFESVDNVVKSVFVGLSTELYIVFMSVIENNTINPIMMAKAIIPRRSLRVNLKPLILMCLNQI